LLKPFQKTFQFQAHSNPISTVIFICSENMLINISRKIVVLYLNYSHYFGASQNNKIRLYYVYSNALFRPNGFAIPNGTAGIPPIQRPQSRRMGSQPPQQAIFRVFLPCRDSNLLGHSFERTISRAPSSTILKSQEQEQSL
jgi:hypothetical protein